MVESSEWITNAPQVIAHRGASGYAPENTLAAFARAVDHKAQAVELDAKLLKDGSIVILHDDTLDRTTNGSGSVYQFEYEDIRNLDAGSNFSSEFNQERIPELEEVFKQIGDQMLINVELTNYAHPWDKLPRRVIELICALKLEKRILLSSFNPWALLVAKRIEPFIPRALLVHPGVSRIIRTILMKMVDHEVYHPHMDLVNESEMNRLKAQKKLVNVWTVNERGRMVELMRLGVDGIISDYPDLAHEVVQEVKVRGDT